MKNARERPTGDFKNTTNASAAPPRRTLPPLQALLNLNYRHACESLLCMAGLSQWQYRPVAEPLVAPTDVQKPCSKNGDLKAHFVRFIARDKFNQS
jgi:hypothetical protein